jgi:uncharacterized protein GlcG (DUF336 family)
MVALYYGFPEPARLDQAAASFKREVLRLIDTNRRELGGLAAGLDREAARKRIAELVATGKQEQAPSIYGLALVDAGGTILAAEAPGGDPLLKNYIAMLQANRVRIPKVASDALRRGRVTSARLYMQDGSQLWVVCSPLRRGRKIVGALLVGFSGQRCRSRRGLTGEQFEAIDFN